MNKEKKFDSIKYRVNWAKEHKKQFRADLDIAEFEHLEELLKSKNLTKAQFLRNSIKELEKK